MSILKAPCRLQKNHLMPELSHILCHPAGWLFMSSIGFNIKISHCIKRKNTFTAIRIYFEFVRKPTVTSMACFPHIFHLWKVGLSSKNGLSEKQSPEKLGKTMLMTDHMHANISMATEDID